LLAAAQQQLSALRLQVVGIAIDTAANVRKFAETVKIAYPVLVADSGAIALMRELGNSAGGLPYTVLLDRRGRLAGRKTGAYSEAELRSALVALLQ
jgi:peroxiredoxin